MVHTTENRGHSPEELAEMALDKIIFVGEEVPEPIRQQALAYRDKLREILLYYMHKAVQSDRATIRGEILTEIKDTH
jgi:hypothetical protein